jgi:hypothetical protein
MEALCAGAERALQVALDVLRERGLLRDPDEPTLAEIRKTVQRWADGQRSGDAWAAYNRVLALIEPKKPEPTWKPGDWVVLAGHTTVLAPNENDPANPVIPGIGGVYNVINTLTCSEPIRPATPDEIAKARGEA